MCFVVVVVWFCCCCCCCFGRRCGGGGVCLFVFVFALLLFLAFRRGEKHANIYFLDLSFGGNGVLNVL